jgi:hypothetical protein
VLNCPLSFLRGDCPVGGERAGCAQVVWHARSLPPVPGVISSTGCTNSVQSVDECEEPHRPGRVRRLNRMLDRLTVVVAFRPPPPTVSETLTTVAQQHAVDVVAGHPMSRSCSGRPWPKECPGNRWGTCCTSNHARASKLHSKPREADKTSTASRA